MHILILKIPPLDRSHLQNSSDIIFISIRGHVVEYGGKENQVKE
jgi:hypothetical protein